MVRLQCPLCGGPLHVEDGARFRCERKHEIAGGDLRVAAGARVTTALWMAIEALETEGEALRMLASLGDDVASVTLADQAEEDARVLRSLASAHLPGEYRVEDFDDAK